jgi:cyclic pyranopterin phosphate synthase
MELTHFDSQGNAIMVDVGAKPLTKREAVAKGHITMSREALGKVKDGTVAKGDVLGVARLAGIMAVKKTAELIPLCHIIGLAQVRIDFTIQEADSRIEAVCTATAQGQTGVEMEALTGVSVALLTIYDMCKALDKSMELGGIHLCRKSGGKSGDYYRREAISSETPST